MNPLLLIALQQAPSIIAMIRTAFTDAHPGEPVPTDEQIIQAEIEAFKASLAKDDAWLAAHPLTGEELED